MIMDSIHTWHVAKTGNNSNSGHAGQYPINLAADAKLTIAAAITAAANGDTIIVWPGTYAESPDFSAKSNILLKATFPNFSSKIIAAGDSAGVLLNPGIDFAIEDFYLESILVPEGSMGSACIAIYQGYNGSLKTLRVKHCFLKSLSIGIVLGDNCDFVDISDDCIIDSSEYGIYVNDTSLSSLVSIRNCKIKTSGWTICHTAGIGALGGRILVRDTQIYASNPASDADHHVVGVVFEGTGNPREVTLDNVQIKCSSPTGGYHRPIEVSEPSGKLFINNSQLNYVPNVITTGDYDVYNLNGDVKVANTAYDRTKTFGVVTEINPPAGSEMALTSAYDAAKTAAQAGDEMTLTEAYDAAKTAAQAGDEMALTDGYDTAIAALAKEADATANKEAVIAAIPSVAGLASQASADAIQNILEGDTEIDKTATPWQIVVKNKTTGAELMRKNLKDVDGSDVTSTTTVIGQIKEPAV